MYTLMYLKLLPYTTCKNFELWANNAYQAIRIVIAIADKYQTFFLIGWSRHDDIATT